MGLGRYVVRRLLEMVPVVLIIIVLNFTIIRLAPGDPAIVLAGEYASKEHVAAIRQAYELDRPIPAQLVRYLSRVLQGDLGRSYQYNRPVLDVIATRIPNTLILVVTAQTLGLIIGSAVGTYSARRYPSATDSVLSFGSLAWYSMPVFWLGMMMVLVLGVNLKIFPASGMRNVLSEATGIGALLDLLHHLALPALAMMFGSTVPVYLRLTRASVIELSREDFATTARAKGLDENGVYFRHILRNALLPTVTVAGLFLGNVLTGAVLTETVFAWPGIGRLTYDAVLSRDYPLLMGLFIISSCMVVIASLLTDITYAILDPRVTFH
ncbi:MAG: ABC transporter permease [Chloroflexi bacterium]|nr:ABC transporter permease [Chloroflexota bacterium]